MLMVVVERFGYVYDLAAIPARDLRAIVRKGDFLFS